MTEEEYVLPWDRPEFKELQRQHDKQQYAHDLICYSENQSCFSCGCNANEWRACYSHEGSPRHRAHQKERELELLERIARAQETK